MTFELNHASAKNYLVPNNTKVAIKLRGEEQRLENWVYRGLDDDQLFLLVSNDDISRWIPVSSISYIEQISE